jgi:hypothetical protein
MAHSLPMTKVVPMSKKIILSSIFSSKFKNLNTFFDQIFVTIFYFNFDTIK